MGLNVADDIKIRVWETSAETRYIVIPQRPDGTAGWTEAQLAEIVSREAMIGVAVVSV
jgi:nitrile hydratase